jgi:hypothetical protein
MRNPAVVVLFAGRACREGAAIHANALAFNIDGIGLNKCLLWKTCLRGT